MKKFHILFIAVFLVIGCSNESDDKNLSVQTEQPHVLKTQKQALDKATGVEQMLQDGANLRRQAIEEQSKN
jgi:uncharacterized protein YcfL